MNPITRSALVLITTSAFASAQTWVSTAGGNWSEGTNWSAAPANDGTANIIFNSNPANPATNTSTVDTNYSILSLVFGNSSGPWTIGNSAGASLTIGAGGITNNAAPPGGGVITVSLPVTIGADQTWNPGTFNSVNRQITLSGTITGTSDKDITVSGAQATNLYRRFVISGTNATTYAGNWIVGSGGRLSLASSASASFGSGTITVNSDGMLGGEGGSANISNSVTLAGGVLRALGGGNAGSLSGNLDITANSSVEIPLGVANTGNLQINNSSTATITGSGNLTVNATGTGGMSNALTIGNAAGVANTVAGTLIVNSDTRVILNKANNTAAWGGNVTINGGGTLAYRTDALRYNQIADTSTVTINGTGVWNMNASTGNQMRERVGALVVNGSAPFATETTASRLFVGGSGVVGTNANGSGPDAPGAPGLFAVAGGTLSGTGTVNKATTLLGGVLSPGDGSVDTLRFSQGLTFGAAVGTNTLAFTLGAASDQVVVTNGLNIGTNAVNFDTFVFSAGVGFGAGTYTLFAADALTGTLGTNLAGTVGGLASTLSVSSNNLVLTVNAPPTNNYTNWVNYWQGVDPGFTNTAGTADPDGDAFDNNEEFAFDGNPTIGTPALLTAVKSGTNAVFNFVARKNPPGGVTYEVKATTNLAAGPWTNSSVTVSNSANQAGLNIPADYERKEFTVPASDNQFFKVDASIAP